MLHLMILLLIFLASNDVTSELEIDELILLIVIGEFALN